MSAMLPPEFADLEPFAPDWCLASEPARYEKRLASSMAEIQSLYDATTPRAEAALAYLDQYPLDNMPDDARNLMYLLYSMVTVSFAVECWHQPFVPDAGATRLDLVVAPTP